MSEGCDTTRGGREEREGDVLGCDSDQIRRRVQQRWRCFPSATGGASITARPLAYMQLVARSCRGLLRLVGSRQRMKAINRKLYLDFRRRLVIES